MQVVFRLVGLVIALNVIRYLLAQIVEMYTFLPYLFGEMEKHHAYFNTEFTRWDWVTSYFYNFMIWLTGVWIFHLMRPVLAGGTVVRSLKVFGLMWLFFASVSAVYMNHYSHPRAFYLYNVLDAMVVFLIVALANGLLYPLFMRGLRSGRDVHSTREG
jgi:hypothetical protein